MALITANQNITFHLFAVDEAHATATKKKIADSNKKGQLKAFGRAKLPGNRR